MSGDEKSTEELTLLKLESASVKMREQGRYVEAVEMMERALVLHQHIHGPASDEVWACCKTLAEMSNLLAMQYLQLSEADIEKAFELLQKAEILSVRDDASKAVTFNNVACYYRRKNRLQASLIYLEKALAIEARLPEVKNPADTHLNTCAVLSQMGRHKQALEHAQSALILLQEELFGRANLPSLERVVVLAIAYHNVGVENEFLKKFKLSLQSYRKGVLVAEKHLGEGHPVTATLRNSFLAASQSVATLRKGRLERQNHGASVRDYSSRARARNLSRRNLSQKSESRLGAISQAYGGGRGGEDASGGRQGKETQQEITNSAGSTTSESVEEALPMLSPRPGQANSGEEQSESKEVDEEGVAVYRKGFKLPIVEVEVDDKERQGGEGKEEDEAQQQTRYFMVQVTQYRSSAIVIAYDVKCENELNLRWTSEENELVRKIIDSSLEEKWLPASQLVKKLRVSEKGNSRSLYLAD